MSRADGLSATELARLPTTRVFVIVFVLFLLFVVLVFCVE